LPPSPQSVNLSCMSPTVGTFTVSVTGSNGTLSHSIAFTFTFYSGSGSGGGGSVGGQLDSVNKLGILAPYIGLASALAFGVALTIVSVKRTKSGEHITTRKASMLANE